MGVGTCAAEYYYDLNHHQWKEDELNSITQTHIQPKTLSDKIAYNAVKAVRFGFDTATGWNGEITKGKVLQRVVFLETIAAGKCLLFLSFFIIDLIPDLITL